MFTRGVLYNVRFQVMTAVLMKIRVFWGLMPCDLVNSYHLIDYCVPANLYQCQKT